MSFFINRVTLTGYLTRDPELGSLPSGLSVCVLSLGSSVRRRNSKTGRWYPKRNRFEVLVLGSHGEMVAERVRKGQLVAIDGRLDWRPAETKDDRVGRVSIIAGTVQFLGSPSVPPTAKADNQAAADDRRSASAPEALNAPDRDADFEAMPTPKAPSSGGAGPAVRTDAAPSSGSLPTELAELDFDLFAGQSPA
jgi:single-strand DNA-binding protein